MRNILNFFLNKSDRKQNKFIILIQGRQNINLNAERFVMLTVLMGSCMAPSLWEDRGHCAKLIQYCILSLIFCLLPAGWRTILRSEDK